MTGGRVVLALGFDLFFKPKLMEAAKSAGVALHFVGDATSAARVIAAAREAREDQDARPQMRVVADASAPGVVDQLEAIHKAHPDLPILACYPHVDDKLAVRVKAVGTGVPRGALHANMLGALNGEFP